jgi:quinolinate synthase
MTEEDLGRAISLRRREIGRPLVILGHHYQTDQVIRHADFTGDSLKLSRIAADLAGARGPDDPLRTVVFCGVHFMAETADMLTPDEVAVILPDLSAGCSMADMAQYDDTVEAWGAVHDSLRGQGWRGRIIPITYVNSSAAIKAFVGEHGGACCTSSNALEVFRWAMAGGDEPGPETKVLFLPDQHLGRNTAAKVGLQVSRDTCVYDPRLTRRGEDLGGATPQDLLRSRVILWAGHCSVHKLFRPEHCAQVRERDAREGTSTRILVHPECCKEVVDLADLSGSTEYIIGAIERAEPGSRWAVGTEFHLVRRLARRAAERGVDVRVLSDCQCLCTTMFRIDQPHLLWVLDNLAGRFDGRGGGKEGRPRVVNQVIVRPEVRRPALLALDRMLRLGGRAPAPALAVD